MDTSSKRYIQKTGRERRGVGVKVEVRNICILVFTCVVFLVSSIGCSLGLDSSDEESSIDVQRTEFYTPPRQPDLSSRSAWVTSWSTTYGGVIRRYDSLRADHSPYITKEMPGMATDRTLLQAYYWTPELYENTVIVAAGLHGNERLAMWALFLFLRHLSEEGEEVSALK